MLRSERIENVAADCVYFKGDQPCQPHAHGGHTCRCALYRPLSKRVLFVQLSSPAEVIASSAILFRMKDDDPNIKITYLTAWPELLPTIVDEPLKFNAANLKRVEFNAFDNAYNLDMSLEACAIFNGINAENKNGFFFQNNRSAPLDDAAQGIYLNKLFPKLSNKNVSLVRNIFQLCNVEYNMEMPFLKKTIAGDAKDIAITTATDPDNPTMKSWTPALFARLTDILYNNGYNPTILGTAETYIKDSYIASNSQGSYPGPLTIREMMDQIKSASTVISFAQWTTQLSWAMGKEVIHVQGQIQKGQTEKIRRLTIVTPLIDISKSDAIDTILPENVADIILAGERNKIENKNPNEVSIH
ncbi:MAG: hypothetical protein JEZ07_01065 [Phycisphaerae bacterium]|nr:hypothetical protein [Phycisphaerae bacterium]